MDQASGVYVGWTAQKNSFADGMPLRNERGDIVLLFSGEEYPSPDIANHLKERGHDFKTEGSSYLIHLYEEDSSFPNCLNGRFHGLVCKSSDGSAMLFNDRFSMHRLYYYESKETFYFAAEAKAIMAVCPETRNPDSRGLGELVSCGCVLENRTLFAGIHVLPPASAWTFRGGAIDKKSTYFEPSEWEQQTPLDPESYRREVREVFSRNLPRYLNGKQPIAMSLTGGLDTRVVMAWQNFSPGAFPCYTYGGTFRECQDVLVAQRVAETCSQPHHVITVGNEFLSRFSHYAERTVYLAEGCVDLSRSPDLYVSEKAREIAPVRITGLYGDEVLRHLRAFKTGEPAPGLFSPEFLPWIDQARSTYQEAIRVHPLSFSVFRQAPWYHHGILSLEESQITARTPFLDNDLVRTVFRAPESASTNNQVRLDLIADGNPALRKIRTDRGFGGNGNRLSAAALRAYLEFTYKAEYAYDYGMPHWVAQTDHWLSALRLERFFLGRHKLFHFRFWYRDALSKYVREMLLDERTLSRPYIQRKELEACVEGHLKGVRNHTTEIHRVLTLELLHRLFFDAI